MINNKHSKGEVCIILKSIIIALISLAVDLNIRSLDQNLKCFYYSCHAPVSLYSLENFLTKTDYLKAPTYFTTTALR